MYLSKTILTKDFFLIVLLLNQSFRQNQKASLIRCQKIIRRYQFLIIPVNIIFFVLNSYLNKNINN